MISVTGVAFSFCFRKLENGRAHTVLVRKEGEFTYSFGNMPLGPSMKQQSVITTHFDGGGHPGDNRPAAPVGQISVAVIT